MIDLNRPSALAVIAAAFVIGGCTSAPPVNNTGTRMTAEADRSSARAELKGELADQWKRGDRMMVDGKKEIARAEKAASDASRDSAKYGERVERARIDQQQAELAMRAGREKVAEGLRLKMEAESSFTYAPLPQK